MDERLQKALDFSNYTLTLNNQKRNIKNRVQQLQLVHHNAGVCTAFAFTKSVYIVPISGTIDLGLPPYIQRSITEAEQNNASAIIFEINTFGGRVDAATQIKDAIINSKVKTIAFIKTMIDLKHTSGVLIDSKTNPVKVSNYKELLEKLVDQYISATQEYDVEYAKLRKSRNIKSIMDW